MPLEGYYKSKYIKEWIDKHLHYRKRLDEKVKAEELIPVDNTSKIHFSPSVCPCCLRMNFFCETTVYRLIDRVCGSMDNAVSTSQIGDYVCIDMKDPSKFKARELEGSGIYAYKLRINNDLTGRLVLLIPEREDAISFNSYVEDAIEYNTIEKKDFSNYREWL